ncbi:hypothetical protein GGI21_003379, partial [Coemansia aciculifera]
ADLFPSLQHLTIRRDYPFGDDTLFRGNAASLEILHMMPSRDICDILLIHSVFAPTSHPKLRRVKIEELPEDMPSHFESSTAYLQFVLGIGPMAAVREIAGVGDKDWLLPALSLFKGHAYIQVLALPDTRLLFRDVVSLIQSLPLLSDLYCLETGVGAMTDDVDLGELTAYFRCWHLGFRSSSDLKDVAASVLGVALLCPNFSHVALSNCVHDDVMMAMEVAIESDQFVRHAPRLRRLLFRK